MDESQDGPLTYIDPLRVYFTFSRIRPQFSCGRRVRDTLDELLNDRIPVHSLPTISVLTDGENLFSLNNRRLFVFKELAKAGKLTTVPARVRPFPNTKRMAQKYTTEKCALVARLKGERREGQGANHGDDGDGEDDEGGTSEDGSEDDVGRVKPDVVAPSSIKSQQAALPHPGAQSQSRTAQKAAKRAAKKGACDKDGGSDDDLKAQLAKLAIANEGNDSDDGPGAKKSKKRKGDSAPPTLRSTSMLYLNQTPPKKFIVVVLSVDYRAQQTANLLLNSETLASSPVVLLLLPSPFQSHSFTKRQIKQSPFNSNDGPRSRSRIVADVLAVLCIADVRSRFYVA